MNMSVSEIVRKDGKQQIYVLFTEDDRTAEGVLPDGKIIKNQGFTDEEVSQLESYMISNVDTIRGMAKQVDLMQAFLGSKPEHNAAETRDNHTTQAAAAPTGHKITPSNPGSGAQTTHTMSTDTEPAGGTLTASDAGSGTHSRHRISF